MVVEKRLLKYMENNKMKKIILGLVLVTSVPLFASSDFERGYREGLKASASTGVIVIEEGMEMIGYMDFTQDVRDRLKNNKCSDGVLSKVTCQSIDVHRGNDYICAGLCVQK